MTTLATAHSTSGAAPAGFFDQWADMGTWPDWNLDTEWVRLDGPFATGTLDVTVSITGPLAPPWTAILAKGFAASVQPDRDRLVERVEQPTGPA